MRDAPANLGATDATGQTSAPVSGGRMGCRATDWKELPPAVPWMVVVSLFALRLWLTAGQTLAACANCTYDDDLFVSLATSFSQGQWLGPYSELTLVRGPFYPIFVGLNALVGLPLSVSQQLFYAAACWLVVTALRPLRLRNTLLALIFAVLLF